MCVGGWVCAHYKQLQKYIQVNYQVQRHSEKLSPAIINHNVVILWDEVESWTNLSMHRGITSTVIIEQQQYTGRCIMGSRQRSPYVGMTRKQDGGFNQCISIYTAILSPGNKCQHLKAFKAAYFYYFLLCCPSLQQH